jgi:hypothetical protein
MVISEQVLKRIVQSIQRLRLPAPMQSEAELVDILFDLLTADGFRVRREVRLDRAGRVDLLVNEHIVVEVKRGKPSRATVRAQVERYAAHPQISGVVLVTERTLSGVYDGLVARCPVYYVALSTLWGVA